MNHALEDIVASRLHGKNLACQRAMRLKATHIEGHCEAMVGVTKRKSLYFLPKKSNYALN